MNSRPVGGACQNMGRTPYVLDDIIGISSVTMNLTSPTQITMDRTATQDITDVGWFVVEWGAAQEADLAANPPEKVEVIREALVERVRDVGDQLEVTLSSPSSEHGSKRDPISGIFTRAPSRSSKISTSGRYVGTVYMAQPANFHGLSA